MSREPAAAPAPAGFVARWAPELALVGNALIWGASFPVVKVALRDASPLVFTSVRMWVAAALMLPFVAGALRRVGRGFWAAGALLGLIMGTAYATQAVGLLGTTASKSAFLTSLSVVLVPFVGGAIFRQRPTRHVWVGALVALAGLFLVAFPGVRAGTLAALAGSLLALNHGDLWTLACALLYALHFVALGYFSPRHATAPLTAVMIAFCALTMTFSIPLEPAPHWHTSRRLLLCLAMTAVLATVLASAVQVWAQRRIPAAHAAIVLALEPVFGLAISFVWLGEAMSHGQLLGCALILAAILWVEAGQQQASPAGSGR